MLWRLGAGGRGLIDQEQAGVRPARNQAAVFRLRGQILRSRPQAAGLLALRRGRRAETRRARRRGLRARQGRSCRSRAGRSAIAPDRPRMVARAGAGDRRGRPLAQEGRASGLPPVRLCRGRQDDARPPHRRRRARRHRLRRLHRQSRAGDALQGLRRRDHHPCAHLPGERGRGRRADLHPQRGRARIPRRTHRDRRMLDGRRRARARPPLVRQADPGARRPVPACRRSRAPAISPNTRPT